MNNRKWQIILICTKNRHIDKWIMLHVFVYVYCTLIMLHIFNMQSSFQCYSFFAYCQCKTSFVSSLQSRAVAVVASAVGWNLSAKRAYVKFSKEHIHSYLSWLSHCGLILGLKEWYCCLLADLHFKKQKASSGGEWFVKPSPTILTCEEKVITTK